MDLAHFTEGLLYVVFSGDLVEVDSNWELPRLYVDCFGRTQLAKQSFVLLEIFNTQGGTHDYQSQRKLGEFANKALFVGQLASGLRNAGKQTDEDVRVQTALVGLINDDDTVLFEQKVLLYFFQQDSIGHKLNLRVLLREVLCIESDLIADRLPYRRAQFICDSLRQ